MYYNRVTNACIVVNKTNCVYLRRLNAPLVHLHLHCLCICATLMNQLGTKTVMWLLFGSCNHITNAFIFSITPCSGPNTTVTRTHKRSRYFTVLYTNCHSLFHPSTSGSYNTDSPRLKASTLSQSLDLRVNFGRVSSKFE